MVSKIATKLAEMEPDALLEKVVALEVQKLHRTEAPAERSDRGDRGVRDRGDRNDRGRGGNDRGDRSSRSSSRDKDRGDRRDRDSRGKRDDFKPAERREPSIKNSKDKTKFYINVGQRDEISRSDLLNFLVEQTGFSKSDFGDVDMDRGHSFFEVDNAKSKQVMGKFRGFSIDGRELKVNPDGQSFEDAPKSKKRKDSKKSESKDKGRRRR